MRLKGAIVTDAQIAVQRLTAWIGQYGDQKQPEFIGDLSMVVLIARDALLKNEKERSVEDVLLSDEFMDKLLNKYHDRYHKVDIVPADCYGSDHRLLAAAAAALDGIQVESYCVTASDAVDVAYGIFPKRSDAGTPKLVKMLGDVVYHNTEDARGAAQLLQRFSDVPLEVRELKATVGNVVKSEPDASVFAEGGDVS